MGLHYLDWGGEGNLLLFVPGLSFTAHAWDAVAPLFTDEFRVVAVTRRWHGASDKTELEFDLRDPASDLAGFIDLFGEGPVVVVGWSYAGLEMPILAAQRPDRVHALVFVDALFDPSTPLPDPPYPLGTPEIDSIYPTPEAAVDEFGLLLPKARPQLLRREIRSQMYQLDSGKWAWQLPGSSPAMRRFFQVMAAWSTDFYADIEVPVLAIRVEQTSAVAENLAGMQFPSDSIEAARRWLETYDEVRKRRAVEALLADVPSAEVIVLDRVSHNFPMEDPDVLADVLGGFLHRLR